MDCYGKNKISPKDGYFRHNLTSDHIEECINKGNCKAGSEINLKGECE